MKISELKQPYRRMAEYLVTQNCIQEASDGIYNFYRQGDIMDLFCNAIDKGNHPPITEEIKKHFPPDFDFSGEEVKEFTKRRKLKKNNYPTKLNIEDIKKIIENYKKGLTQVQSSKLLNINNAYLGKILHCYLGNEKAKQKIGIAVNTLITKIKEEEILLEKQTLQIPNNPTRAESFITEIKEENISLFDKENQRKIEDENLQKRIYTQLAKEGKFDELPDTCEFSEAVELEVAVSKDLTIVRKKIYGKFKGNYVTDVYISPLTFAQLPTPKIDFSDFKTGDVVEVELSNEEKRIGWFDFTNNNHLYIRILQRKGNQICNGGSCAGTKIINKEKIKSITKIK